MSLSFLKCFYDFTSVCSLGNGSTTKLSWVEKCRVGSHELFTLQSISYSWEKPNSYFPSFNVITTLSLHAELFASFFYSDLFSWSHFKSCYLCVLSCSEFPQVCQLICWKLSLVLEKECGVIPFQGDGIPRYLSFSPRFNN